MPTDIAESADGIESELGGVEQAIESTEIGAVPDCHGERTWRSSAEPEPFNGGRGRT